jgi:hypothetical protein
MNPALNKVSMPYTAVIEPMPKRTKNEAEFGSILRDMRKRKKINRNRW